MKRAPKPSPAAVVASRGTRAVGSARREAPPAAPVRAPSPTAAAGSARRKAPPAAPVLTAVPPAVAAKYEAALEPSRQLSFPEALAVRGTALQADELRGRLLELETTRSGLQRARLRRELDRSITALIGMLRELRRSLRAQ